MVKLCERALVKDLLSIPRADQRQDPILDSLIQAVSDECERMCRRHFSYQSNIVEYHPSFDQMFTDPEPQFLVLWSYPLDPNFMPQIQWSPYDHRQGLTVTLEYDTGDYVYYNDTGMISIRYMGVASTNLPFIGGLMFTYHPRGFQVTYAGGYPVTTTPSPDDAPDPMDDYGVTQVPDGLKLAVAKKVAADFRSLRPTQDFYLRRGMLNPAATALDNFLQDLRPYRKKDLLF